MTHYGRTRIVKLQAAVNALRAVIRSEGTPAIQDAWGRVEPWVDRIFTTRNEIGMPGYITRGPEPGVYDVEYIPKALSDALVAEMCEAAVSKLDLGAHIMSQYGTHAQTQTYQNAAKMVRDLTDTDARAALDAYVKREVEVERSRCAEIARNCPDSHWGPAIAAAIEGGEE